MIATDEIGRLLRSAREAWAFSPNELAQRADVPVRTIRDAERNGRLSLTDLEAITAALGGSIDDVIGGRPFWTASSIALKKSEARFELAVVRSRLIGLTAAANTHRALGLLLAIPDQWEAQGAPLGPKPMVHDVVKQAESLAQEARARVDAGDGPLSSVRDFCARFGVTAFLTDLGTSTVDGIMWRERGAPPCIAANVAARRGATTAIRMTLAHELCHALFDRPKVDADGILEERSDDATGREQRANAFAAHLLAPRRAVLAALERLGWRPSEVPTPQHLRALAQSFGIGVEAMAFHLVSCGVWSNTERQARRAFSVPYTSHDDREHVSPTPGERLVELERRGQVLDLATAALAADAITVGRWRELLKLSVHGDWQLLLAERHIEV